MDGEIAERRLQPDANRTDLLSLMMAARDENGQPMTNCDRPPMPPFFVAPATDK